MENNLVNVVDPDTQEVGSISQDQLQEAMNQGYQQATPDQVHSFVNSQKYGTPGQQLGAAAEGAASAATFGLSTGLERAMGVPAEDIQGRREENPISSGLGQVGGLLGSLAIPGLGAGNLLESAGAAGAKALIPGAESVYGAGEALQAAKTAGTGVEEAGQAYNAAKAAQPFIARIGTPAADQAIQAALFQSGDEVSKMFSGAPGYEDPGTAAQTAITNIGLGGLIGGALGAGFGVVSPLWKATYGQKLENGLDALKNSADGVTSPAIKSLEDVMGESGVAPEIRARMSENPVAVSTYQQLIESGTQPGEALRQARDATQDALVGKLKGILDSGENTSAFEAGEKAKESILAKAEELNAPIKAGYESVAGTNDAIQIPDAARKQVFDKMIEAGQDFGAKGSVYEDMFKNYANRLIAQDTVSQQDKLMTEIGSELNVARRSGDFEKARALGEIKDLSRDFQDEQIAKSAKLVAGDDPVALKAAQDFIDQRVQNRKMYAGFMENIRDIASNAKLGKVKSYGQLQEALDKVPSAKLADKLFDKKNIEGLNYLKENFPDILDTLVKSKKQDLLEKSIKGEDFLHNKLLTSIQGIPKEVKNIMFTPEELKTIETAGSTIRTLGERINPSGTARGIDEAMKHWPSGVLGSIGAVMGHGGAGRALGGIGGTIVGELGRWVGKEVPDAIKISLLKYLGQAGPTDSSAWKTAVDLIDKTYKGQKIIQSATKNIFKAGETVLPSKMIPDSKSRETLDDKLKKLQADQSPLTETGGKVGYYLPSHGSSLAQTAVSATNYLNGLRPNLDKKAPLDSEPIQNAVQKSKFERALDIAEQPLVILKDVKDGSVTPDDLVHLNSMYPSLYTKLKQDVMNQTIEATHNEEPIPYKTRLGVSVFMGQPLDSTMTPQALMALNPPPQAPQQPQIAQGKPRHSSMKNIGQIAASAQTPGQARESRRLQS